MSDVMHKAQRGTVMHLGAQLSLMASSYALSLVLARGLGPAAFGVYGVVYSLLLAVELVSRFGLPEAASKLLAERGGRDAGLEATALTMGAVVHLCVFAVFWLAAPLLAQLLGIDDGTRLFRIAALDIPAYGLMAASYHLLNGRRMFHLESSGLAIYGLTRLVGIVVLLAVGPTVAGALALNVATSLVALAFFAWHVGRDAWRPTLVEWRPIVRLAVPIAVTSMGSTILISLDLWMLSASGSVIDDVTRGHYVAAATIARIPNLVANAMAAVLLPSIAAALVLDDGDVAGRAYRGAMRFLAVTLIGGCALVAANAEGVLVLLFGGEYGAAAPLLQILIFSHGLFLTVFLSLCGVAVGCGRAAAAGTAALVAIVPAAILDLVLIRQFGEVGAAWGALAALVAVTVYVGVLIGRRLGAPLERSPFIRIVAAAAVVAFVSSRIETAGLWLLVELAVAGIAYLGLIAALGVVTRQDLAAYGRRPAVAATGLSEAQS